MNILAALAVLLLMQLALGLAFALLLLTGEALRRWLDRIRRY